MGFRGVWVLLCGGPVPAVERLRSSARGYFARPVHSLSVDVLKKIDRLLQFLDALLRHSLCFFHRRNGFIGASNVKVRGAERAGEARLRTVPLDRQVGHHLLQADDLPSAILTNYATPKRIRLAA